MSEYAGQIIMIVVLFAVMYFMLIRPQRKKDDEVRKMRDSLKVGDDVLTIGGIYGKIVRIREDRITLQIGLDKTKIEVAKWAINNVESRADSKTSKTSKDEDAEKEKKVTPKSIKKLGEKTETAAEEPAAEDAQE